MKRIVLFVSSGFSILLLACASLWAQGTAQISGTVKDQSGAVLPGVDVTATNTDTGVSRMTVTNETGSFVLPNLPIGPYRLEGTLPGFRTFAQSGIVLQVGTNPVINPVLEVGQVSEQVEVQANAEMVETRTTGIGQVMENQRILELPLNGRNVTELIALAGASTPGTAGNDSRNPFNKDTLSIAGGLSTGVAYTLDGANHNNPYNNLNLSIPFPDALQEFKVETGALTAQNGMHSAAAVNVVTKSGTNDTHGDLFEFVRNGKFNARNAFATRRDTFKRNQFGGTLGGAIEKNKFFYFVGYQGTTIRQDPSDILKFVPTPAMLAGDFTTITSPACNAGRTITLRAPFVNNRIDPSLFSRAALALTSKLPTTTDPCGRIIYGNLNRENDHMAVGRLDYQLSAKQSIFGRYLLDSIENPHPYSLNHNLLSTAASGATGLNQAFTFGDTYLISPTMVNSFHISANRSATVKTAAEFFNLSDIGVKMFSYDPKRSVVNVTGGFDVSGVGNARGPTNTAIFQLADDLSIVRGTHQMAVGASLANWRANAYSNAFGGSVVTFNGQITGLGMADFLTGNVFNFLQAPNEIHNGRQWYTGLYAADTWKASRKLTLNYGLRWEPFFAQQFTDRGAYHFDIAAFRKGLKTSQFQNAPPGLFYPGDPGFPGLAGMNNQYWNFSPRVGLAWDPNGDGKTSVRASFGTLYDFVPIQYMININISPPWDPKVQVQNVSFDDPWRSFPGGNPFPVVRGAANAVFTPYSVLSTMNYDTHNTQVYQWNLSIQRQLGTDWLAAASYLGSNTIHLWTVKPINPAVYLGTGPCTLAGVSYASCSTTANTDQRRVLSLENPAFGQYYGNVNLVDDGGTTSYHGLLLSLQRRAARGVTVNTNYTWSHCIGDPYQSQISGGSGNAAYTDPNNRRADRGNCTTTATDRRHVFNLSAVAESPRFSNSTTRAIASGWRLSPILKIQSGQFITVTTSSDVALNGIGGQRINQVLPNVYGDKSISNYLNPAAFAMPTTGTRGNMGSGTILGPGFWQFDAALSRVFQVTENNRLEFRAEAFNVTNSLRMMNPVTNFNSNTFGQVIAARDPRIMQFALKYVF